MGTAFFGLLMCLGLVSLSIAGLLLVRSEVSFQFLKQQHDVAGFMIAVLGVLYGVLLGFAVILVWGQFEDASKAVDGEASDVVDLMRLSKGLPVPFPEQARAALVAYVNLVITDEWKTMGNGEISLSTQQSLSAIWRIFRDSQPGDSRGWALYSQELETLRMLTDHRRARIHASQAAVPDVIWVVLWAGAFITVGFTYFFGVESFRLQALMTIAISGEIALILFVIVALDNPFRGEFRLSPRPLQNALERLSDPGER